MSETSTAGPLEGVDGDPERPPPMSEMLMAAPLGGADGDLGAPITYVRDVDGRPPGRC
jgi:hypothetical protein